MPYSVDKATIRRIHAQVEAVKHSRYEQDVCADRVRMVRQGNIELISPDFFADDLPKSVVANIIDVAARDQAELMAPLPALACSSGNMATQADRERATKANKIGAHYWTSSLLPVRNINFADSINSYSFGAYIAEPDYEARAPKVRFESSFGSYYFKDRWGRMQWYAKCKEVTVGELLASYPDKVHLAKGPGGLDRPLNEKEKLVLYQSAEYSCAYLPDAGFEILSAYKNPVRDMNGKPVCPVVIAERPDVEAVPRGQYDDVVWPALAKARMAQYMLKAADFSVNAPWALPDDVTELNMGADAIIRSQQPEKVRKVSLQIPQDVFVLAQELDRGTKEGARYPEARTGGIQGNIITGRGVQELMGTMDTQIRTMQTVIGQALEEITLICFYMDRALWPNEQKTIEGVLAGKPYRTTYIPAKDCQVNHVKVTYGFAAGLSPTQALVAMLQLRADDQISRDTARRNLPFDIDPEQEQSQVDSERLEDALVQGVAAFAQAMGPMAMQGQSPVPILRATAAAIVARRKGKPIADAILDAFEEPEPEEPPAEEAPLQGSPQEPGPPGAGPEGELPPGIGPSGLTQGVPYGQAGLPPGGMPDVQSLMAALRGGGQQPRLEASVMRKRAVA